MSLFPAEAGGSLSEANLFCKASSRTDSLLRETLFNHTCCTSPPPAPKMFKVIECDKAFLRRQKAKNKRLKSRKKKKEKRQKTKNRNKILSYFLGLKFYTFHSTTNHSDYSKHCIRKVHIIFQFYYQGWKLKLTHTKHVPYHWTILSAIHVD